MAAAQILHGVESGHAFNLLVNRSDVPNSLGKYSNLDTCLQETPK